MKTKWISSLGLVALALTVAFGEAQAQQEPVAVAEQPNVVVIILDTQRPDRLGLDAQGPQNSPWMRSIAERGARFDRARSTSSWTVPSMASLFSGQYPNRHAVVEGALPSRKHAAEKGIELLPLPVLDKPTKTLPQRFAAAGYTTVGVNTNTLMMRRQGFERGFEVFRKFTAAEFEDYSGEREPDPNAVSAWALETREKAPVDAEQVVDWVKTQEQVLHGDKPFFLWVHLTDPHQPYHRRSPYFQESSDPHEEMVNAYDSEVRYTDRWLQTMVEDMSLAENTYIVVVSDHGDAFGEHGHYGHGTAGYLYREVNDVVMLIAGPGIQPGLAPDINVSLVDVYPTLVGLTGIGQPKHAVDGVDLSPLLRGDPGSKALMAKLRERPIFAIRTALKNKRFGSWMVLRKNWKLMETDASKELYDLGRDPGEQRNLHGQAPDGVQSGLEALLQAHRDGAVIRVAETLAIDVDPDTLEALRAMGYIE